MKTIAHLFLFYALTSLGCAPDNAVDDIREADNARKSQIDDIREAVFRWQFAHNASGQQKKAQVYFLDVGDVVSDATGSDYTGSDPTDEFMERFADHTPPVRKLSASTGYEGDGVRDKTSGERGLLFRVKEIHWKSDTQVEVRGGYFEDGLSASENTYTVRKEDGKWKVTNDRLESIS